MRATLSSSEDLLRGAVMQVYEIVVQATVSETFRIIADSDEDATARASLMFSNEVTAKVLNVQFSVQNKETDALLAFA